MAIRCGIDIIEVDRIRESFESLGQAFRDRIFTDKEIAYCESRKGARFESYAARFAAKEAVSKAIGTGIGGDLGWKDIEILKDTEGKPYVVLSPAAAKTAWGGALAEISLSLSHCKAYAVASVVIEFSASQGGGLTENG
jgi:holo-[acyl-carrier protein] synthase